MSKTAQVPEQRAGRAFGALLLGGFGTVWLVLWAWRSNYGHAVPMAIVAAIGLGSLLWVYAIYRRLTAATVETSETPAQRRAIRIFHIVNFGQWIVILVVGNVLANLGLGAWVIPMAIAVIGLHFIPLAHIFKSPSRYLTGAALLLVAICYPLLLPAGPASSVGCLCAGMILWISALWGLRKAG